MNNALSLNKSQLKFCNTSITLSPAANLRRGRDQVACGEGSQNVNRLSKPFCEPCWVKQNDLINSQQFDMTR